MLNTNFNQLMQLSVKELRKRFKELAKRTGVYEDAETAHSNLSAFLVARTYETERLDTFNEDEEALLGLAHVINLIHLLNKQSKIEIALNLKINK